MKKLIFSSLLGYQFFHYLCFSRVQKRCFEKKLLLEHVVLWCSGWELPESAFSFELFLCCCRFFFVSDTSSLKTSAHFFYLCLKKRLVLVKSIQWNKGGPVPSDQIVLDFPKVLSLLIYFLFELFVSATTGFICYIRVWTEKRTRVESKILSTNFVSSHMWSSWLSSVLEKATETSCFRLPNWDNSEITVLISSTRDSMEAILLVEELSAENVQKLVLASHTIESDKSSSATDNMSSRESNIKCSVTTGLIFVFGVPTEHFTN